MLRAHEAPAPGLLCADRMSRSSLWLSLGALLALITVTDMSAAAGRGAKGPKAAKTTKTAKAAKPAKTAKGARPAKAAGAAAAPASSAEAPAFDRQAAASALSSVDLTKCKAPNAKRGEGHVTLTFASTGEASRAVVDRGAMAGTPVARCIAGAFQKARVPAFSGEAVQVGKSFRFD
jgi:hypothetical protein